MIFLLGHKGFIGSAIAEYLGSENIDFVGIDRNNYNDYIEKACDIFINAGGSSRKRLAEEDPKKDFELNVLSVLNTTLDFKFGKYLLISSIDVYNDVSDERNNSEGALINPRNLSNYGFSKWLCEQIVMKYCNEWLILRLGGMVGKGLKKNAVFDLITSKSLYVNPLSEYQYMNTLEVARLLWKLRNRKNDVFNVCGDGTIKLEDIAKQLGISLDRRLYSLPKQKYSISISKVQEYENVETTEKAVFDFVAKI